MEFEHFLNDPRKKVHFIGIGGIGMSALARWFLAQKWAVSGSDLVPTDLTKDLRKEGAQLILGPTNGYKARPHLVVRTQAIPPAHPEYHLARKHGVATLTYPQMLGILTKAYNAVGVAGAHGKSTTTALVSLILMKAGFDPTIIIGTKLRELGGSNFRSGKSDTLVFEADEYGRAFLEYSPLFLLVTNIDREHLDTYRDLADIKRTFLSLFKNIKPGGALVLNADNDNLLSLRKKIEAVAKEHDLKVHWYSLKDPVSKKIKKALKLPGLHNLSNATGAYVLARKVLNIPGQKILGAIGGYSGSWRRFEYRGKFRSAAVEYDVYDDYAHHPTEIRATLQAFREKFRKDKLICVFQPHQAERLKKLFPEFIDSFGDADALLLFPEYRVAGREEKPTRFTSEALAAAILRKHPKQKVSYIDAPGKFSRKYLLGILSAHHEPQTARSIVIMMGAGNIVEYTDKLLK